MFLFLGWDLWDISTRNARKRGSVNLREIRNWLLLWAVIFDRLNLTASQAAIFASVRVVFLDCPFLDCLNHDVTTSTVGVTSFTNHSIKRANRYTVSIQPFLVLYTFLTSFYFSHLDRLASYWYRIYLLFSLHFTSPTWTALRVTCTELWHLALLTHKPTQPKSSSKSKISMTKY